MKGHRVSDRRNQLAKLWHCRVTTVRVMSCTYQSHLRKSTLYAPCILSCRTENAEFPRSWHHSVGNQQAYTQTATGQTRQEVQASVHLACLDQRFPSSAGKSVQIVGFSHEGISTVPSLSEPPVPRVQAQRPLR